MSSSVCWMVTCHCTRHQQPLMSNYCCCRRTHAQADRQEELIDGTGSCRLKLLYLLRGIRHIRRSRYSGKEYCPRDLYNSQKQNKIVQWSTVWTFESFLHTGNSLFQWKHEYLKDSYVLKVQISNLMSTVLIVFQGACRGLLIGFVNQVEATRVRQRQSEQLTLTNHQRFVNWRL